MEKPNIAFPAHLASFAEKEYEEYWIVSDMVVKKYVDGDVVTETTIDGRSTILLEYVSRRRYIHQRDGHINQARINRENIQVAILRIPSTGKGLGALRQDHKILSKNNIKTILLFDKVLSSSIVKAFISEIKL